MRAIQGQTIYFKDVRVFCIQEYVHMSIIHISRSGFNVMHALVYINSVMIKVV